MRALAIACCVAAGCKADDRPGPPAERRVEPGPTTATSKWRGPKRELPVIEGAKQLVAPRTTPDHEDMFTSWCLDTGDASAAATRVAEALRADGWSDVVTRGEPPKIVVGARSGDRRISVVVGGSDPGCTGATAAATVVRAGKLTPPPVQDGDQIR